MQYKIKINFLAIFVLFLCFGFYTNAFAQSASTTSVINAEVLYNVWYSTTTVNEGDEINIYAGFQNHSGENVSGTAGFFVDSTQLSKVSFTTSPKSLIKLEAKYTAVRGEHIVQVKILDIKNLLASETEKKGLSVKYQITSADVLNSAQKVTNSIINIIDTYTTRAADYVENLKQPAENSDIASDDSSSTSSKIAAKIYKKSTEGVSGTSIETQSTDTQNSGQMTTTNWKTYSYNLLLDIVAFLLRHWVWTFSSVIIFILYLTLR